MKDSSHNAISVPNTVESSALSTVAARLEEAEVSPDRFIRLRDGSKAPVSHDTFSPEAVTDGNYGVYAGDGLVLIDIDSYRDDCGQLPDEVQALRSTLSITFRIGSATRKMDVEPGPATLTVESPHGGEHLYYAVSGDVSNSTHEWGEIRAENQYVVNPGSRLTDCDKEWHDCSADGEGGYVIKHDRPIASIDSAALPTKPDDNTGITTASGGGTITGDSPEYEETDTAVATHNLKTLQREHGPAFQCLMDRLNGGRGTLGGQASREDGSINRSAVDFLTLEHLYGVMVIVGREDEQRARHLAYAVYSHFAEERDYMKDGRQRKWLQRDEQYRQDRLDWAVRTFDRGEFQRWLNKSSTHTEEWRGWTGDYSETTYNATNFTLKWLSGYLPMDYADLDTDTLRDMALTFDALDVDRETLEDIAPLPTPLAPLSQEEPLSQDSTPLGGCISPNDYPTKGRVVEVARRLDEEHNAERSYDEALNRLRRDGIAVMACMKEGVDYRYYHHGCPRPEDAEYIKTDGKKIEPS